MVNTLVRPEHMCRGSKKNGDPCTSPRRRGQPFCIAHSPGRWSKVDPPVRDGVVNPSESLETLLHLNLTEPGALARLASGLMQHVIAGTVKHQQAESVLRMADLVIAASVRKESKSKTRSAVDAIFESAPPSTEPPGGEGEIGDPGQVGKGPVASTEPEVRTGEQPTASTVGEGLPLDGSKV